jgi:hypothetical protein
MSEIDDLEYEDYTEEIEMHNERFEPSQIPDLKLIDLCKQRNENFESLYGGTFEPLGYDYEEAVKDFLSELALDTRNLGLCRNPIQK